MQHEYLSALRSKIEADGRIKAAWLEGSFGRGNADRYSDLDIHFLIPEHNIHTFQAAIETWLASIRPLVLFNLLFDGKMVNALTRDGLRLDLWLHAGESTALDKAKTLMLFDTEQSVRFDQAHQSQEPPAVPTLERQTKEFWRCISLLPAVIGRGELITGFNGLIVETNLLAEILLTGYGIARDTGVKNLNRFLPGDTRRQIEEALSMHGLSQQSLAKAHLGLARMLQDHGRTIAARRHYEYPAELEATVLRYVHAELKLLGLEAGALDDGKHIGDEIAQ
jgi:hypothetical protein